MPDAGLFASLGVFVAERFLDPEACARLRREIDAAPGEAAGIYQDADIVNRTARRAAYARVPADTAAAIADRIAALKAPLERHFGIELHALQTPHFLVYEPGDFFKAHADAAGEPAPDYIRERLVSVVIFLNDQSDEPAPGAFSGGSLTFYDLVPDARFGNLGLPLAGREGLLVAFRADRLHAVTPVTAGRRFTIVAWFC